MRVTFRLRYHTDFGQSLWLTGNHELLGNGQAERAIALQYLNEEFWQVRLVMAAAAMPEAGIVYSYLLREAEGTVVQDWARDRIISLAAFKADELLIIDSWNSPGQCENVFYTEPFKQVLLKPNRAQVRAPAPAKVTHIFKVKAPLLVSGQTLCLLGNTPALGQWHTAQPVLLNRPAEEDFYTAELDLSRAVFPLEYKYGVYDLTNQALVRYEEGRNRGLVDSGAPDQLTIVNDGFAALPATTWKGAGVALPVFSLRSAASFGVGEFTDLKLLADWCQQAGLKMIQILPVNDTTATHTWMDSYPYAAISAFALHPLYLNLREVATGQNQRLLANLEAQRKRLNALEQVDYEAVLNAKLGFLRQIYPSEKQNTFRREDYRLFFERNQHWLEPYAAFCFLRDQFGTADFTGWPRCRSYQPEECAGLAPAGSAAAEELGFHYFLQYHLHAQLLAATQYAHSKGVILKGDIPIGVCRHGADAWQQPELYHLDMQAGAPPDAFAVKGQNWGFPTYNWPRMKATGFAWWKRRLEQMGHYFDAFRLDHILGFFRIWSIPSDAVEGILGHFVPCLPVALSEFASRGIRFDRDRYLQPYITDAVLQEVFPKEAAEVRKRFLQAKGPGDYGLKPEFTTQRQVEQYFAALEPDEHNARLRAGLFDLISNVILLEAEGRAGQQYHLRFGLAGTSSFKHLDGPSRAQLRELYVDYFFRRQDAGWRQEAMQKLPALKRVTNMLVCGEDLGLVPACVPEAMKQLGLLSLEVQRMPKRHGQEFSRPKDAPYLSVVTPSTHDMSTVRAWWEEDRGVTQKFFSQELGQPGAAPVGCQTWISKAIVLQHLASPAMWAVFQLQDLLGMDERLRRPNPQEERINVPASSRNYWRYRMHLPLEELLAAEAFNAQLKGCIEQNGR